MDIRLVAWSAHAAAALLAVSLVACGDDAGDGGDAGAVTDAGGGDGGGPVDGGPGDAGADEDAGGGGTDAGAHDGGPVDPVTITGQILGEDVGSGPPPIAGATVSIVWLDGTEFDSGTTDGDGMYSVTGPKDTLMLLRVEPITGYLGNIRGEPVRGMDYEAYALRLAQRDRVEAAVDAAGSTYDETLGYLVAGFNPVSVEAGGEGATLSGVTHDPAFVLYPGGTLVTNVLPPICSGSETPEEDECALAGRNNQVFYPNVDGEAATVDIVDPAGGTCTERFGVEAWPVFPDTLITVNIDCAAS